MFRKNDLFQGLPSEPYTYITVHTDHPGRRCFTGFIRQYPQGNALCTLIKKKITFFFTYKEIMTDRLQSHTWLTASSYMGKNLRTSSYIRKPFILVYIWLCTRSHLNFLIFFISVWRNTVLCRWHALFFLWGGGGGTAACIINKEENIIIHYPQEA